MSESTSKRAAAIALAAGLVLVTGACNRPGHGPRPTTTAGPRTTTPPTTPAGGCREIDFETASVSGHRLTVSGTKPSIGQTVELNPVTYIRQPEYWAIEVTVCDPVQPSPAITGPYTVTLDLTGTIGTNGIEVVGATRTQRFDVP